MKIDQIITDEPFASLFPIHKDVLQRVMEHMREHGYESYQPIVCWNRSGKKDGPVTVIDGHTRVEAAKACGMTDIPVEQLEFAGEDEAIQHAIHCQRDRRNLDDADLFRIFEKVDKRKDRGRPSGAFDRGGNSKASPEAFDAKPEKLASSEANSGKSAANTASIIKVSRAKAERMRAISDHASPKVKAAVKEGKMSINQAYVKTRQQRIGRGISKIENPLNISKTIKEEEVADEEFVKAHTQMALALYDAKRKKWATVSQQTAARYIHELLAIIG